MAKEIRDPLTIIGILERGEASQQLGEEIRRTLAALYEAAGPKGKAKGSVAMTLNFEVMGASCSIEASIASKTPKQKRASTMLFVNAEGALLQEHPSQINLFPQDVAERRNAGVAG